MRATPNPHASGGVAVAGALLLWLSACSTSPSPRRSTSGIRELDGGFHHSEPEASAPTPAPVCIGPGYAGAPADQRLSHLSAIVVDESGRPIPKIVAQACGTNVCVNGTTDDSGAVVIDQDVAMTKPAFKYGGGQAYAKFALPLSGADVVAIDLGKQATFAFDPPEAGAALTPGAIATSHGVMLTLASRMADIAPDPFDFDTKDLRKLRAIEIPMEKAPDAVDPSLGFEILIGLTPTGTELCPAAKMSVPNSPKWSPGSRVEVFLHGIDVAEEWAPYGGWAKVSDGAVSADGTSVETDSEGGLPALSVVGIRLAR